MKTNRSSSYDNLRTEARQLRRKGMLDMVVADYLTLFRVNQKFEKRYLKIGYIAREFKWLAKEPEVSVIVISQLNRPPKVEKVEDPAPEISVIQARSSSMPT